MKKEIPKVMGKDLISRKEVLGVITPKLNSSNIGGIEYQRLYSVLEEVKNMPTAYDVDKVVERLERKVLEIKDQLMYTFDEDMAVRLRCKMHGLDEAIESIISAVKIKL